MKGREGSHSYTMILALVLVAWMSISVSSILVLLSRATSLQAAFWRVTLGTLILFFASSIFGSRPSFLLNMKTILSGVMLAFHFLVWMQSLFYIPVALSTALVVWYPGINAVIDRFVFKEKITSRQIIGLIIAITGTLLMLSPQLSKERIPQQWLIGVILALLGAFFAAGYFAIGRVMRKHGTAISDYAVNVYGIASLTLFLFSLISGSQLKPTYNISWIYLLLLALVPMIGGHTVMNYLLKELKTVTVTSIALGEPAGATILAYIILNQKPHILTITGMIITIIGLYMVLSRTGEKPKNASNNKIINQEKTK